MTHGNDDNKVADLPDSRAYRLYGPDTRDVPAGTRSASFGRMVDENAAGDLRVVAATRRGLRDVAVREVLTVHPFERRMHGHVALRRGALGHGLERDRRLDGETGPRSGSEVSPEVGGRVSSRTTSADDHSIVEPVTIGGPLPR